MIVHQLKNNAPQVLLQKKNIIYKFTSYSDNIICIYDWIHKNLAYTHICDQARKNQPCECKIIADFFVFTLS